MVRQNWLQSTCQDFRERAPALHFGSRLNWQIGTSSADWVNPPVNTSSYHFYHAAYRVMPCKEQSILEIKKYLEADVARTPELQNDNIAEGLALAVI